MPRMLKQVVLVTLVASHSSWLPAPAASQVGEKDPRVSAAESRRARLLDGVIPVGEYCLDLLSAHHSFDPVEGRNILNKSFSVDQMSDKEKAACREKWARRHDQQLDVAATDLTSHTEGLGVMFRTVLDKTRLYREHMGSRDEDFAIASALYEEASVAREGYLDSLADLWDVWEEWRSRLVLKSFARGNPRDPLSRASPPLPSEFVVGTVKIQSFVRDQAGRGLEVFHSGPTNEPLVEVEIPASSKVNVVRTKVPEPPEAPTPLLLEFSHRKKIEDVTREDKYETKTRTLYIPPEHATQYEVCSWRHRRESDNGKITGPDLVSFTDSSITYTFSAAFNGKRAWHNVKVTLAAIRRNATDEQKLAHGCGKLKEAKSVGLCYVIERTADDNSHQALQCVLSRKDRGELFQCFLDWNNALKEASCVIDEDVCESLYLKWPDVPFKEYERGLVPASRVEACR